jgi:arsenate reductase
MRRMTRPITVLVLCTGNSARSILGEVLINELGGGRLRAFSAGSHPTGRVNPGALAKLRREGHAVAGLTSKSWDQFSGPDAPSVDIVITVCDNAAGESCPVWRGSPVSAHWGIPDPAIDTDDKALIDAAFDRAYLQLRGRVEAMLALPIETMAAAELSAALQQVHSSRGGAAA